MEKVMMIRPSQLRRLALLLLLLLVAFAGLGYRLVDLQLRQHEKLSWYAAKRQNTVLRLPRRGEIRDARGNVLATSLFVKTVCADPSLVGTNQALVARTLAPLLKVNEAELRKLLQPRRWVDSKGEEVEDKHVVLKRKVPVEDWNRIQQVMKDLPLAVVLQGLTRRERMFYRNLRLHAVYTEPVDDQLRVYPNGTLAAHVLGYVGMTERNVGGRVVTDIGGKDGIEKILDATLNGVAGWRQTETDRRSRELVVFREADVEPRPGLDAVLTLDAGLQDIVEEEISKAWEKHSSLSISAVVVRPRTGEILALANLPNFDPNKPGSQIDHLRNRVISDVAEPGSTFKIVVVSGALNDQTVNLEDQFDCEHGHFSFAGRTLRDHDAYGVLSVENIITKSSNIGAAKIGIKMGASRLHQYIREFGFGERTGIPLPGEVRGFAYPLDRWTRLSISRIPMGHEVATTPLQMVMAMSAIANGGRLMRPMLVSRLEDDQGQVVVQYQPQVVRQVISEATARQMVAALTTVVSPNGTGAKARLEHYPVAGKTGTAQKAGNGGYLPGKYFSSFLGFFPADNPELCISIVLDEPKHGYYGGETAAPVFKAIAERAAVYLGVRPAADPPAAVSDILTETDNSNPLTTARTGRSF